MNITTLLNVKQIFEQVAQTKISSKLAYKIMKFYKNIEVEEKFYNDRRMEIINTYSEKDANGQPIISNEGIVNIIPEKIQEANMAMWELNNMEVEVPNIKFTLAELEEVKLSVADMYALDAFIEE